MVIKQLNLKQKLHCFLRLWTWKTDRRYCLCATLSDRLLQLLAEHFRIFLFCKIMIARIRYQIPGKQLAG